MAKKRATTAPQTRSHVAVMFDRLAPGAGPAWIVAGVLAAWACGYTVMRGSDLWWHLATGRWIVEHRAIPFDDPWSFTATRRWVVDAWLTDVIVWLWSRAFGMMSLAFWKWILMAATFVVIQRTVSRRWNAPGAGWVATLFGMAVAAPFLDIRPQLHSFFCYALLLALTLHRPRPHWGVVPLLWLWTSLHAGFTLGVVTLPILLVPSILDRDERNRSILLGVAAIAICLVNPNGIAAFTQPIIYALEGDSPFQTIGEWLPPFRPGGIVSPLYPWAIAIAIIASLAIVVSRRRPVPLVEIALLGLTLAMSLKSRRFVPVFALTTPLVVTPLLASFGGSFARRLPAVVAPLGAIALGLLMLRPFPQKSYAFHYLTAEYTFPVETMNFIDTNRLEGKLFGYFNWGGYIHLRTDGRMKVFIDGRASAVFDEQTYLDYVRVLAAKPGWQSVVLDSRADFFLWPRSSTNLIQGLLATGQWKAIYADSVSILLARADRTLPRLVPTPASPYKTLAEGVSALSRGDIPTARSAFQETLRAIPWQGRACDYLMQAEVLAGEIDAGRRRFEQCEDVFPLDGRREQFDRAVAQYARTKVGSPPPASASANVDGG